MPFSTHTNPRRPSIYSSARTELAKLLIDGLFQKSRVLAQDAIRHPVWPIVAPQILYLGANRLLPEARRENPSLAVPALSLTGVAVAYVAQILSH